MSDRAEELAAEAEHAHAMAAAHAAFGRRLAALGWKARATIYSTWAAECEQRAGDLERQRAALLVPGRVRL